MDSYTTSALAFFALAMTIISAWVKRSAWIWGGFLIFAFALGYFAKLIEPIAMAPIGGLLILHSLLKGDIKGLARFILVLLTIAVSLGLTLHKLPGFNNWLIVEKAQLTENATPFSLYLNFDKPFIGIFVLVLGFPLLQNLQEFRKMLKVAIPLILCGIAIMIVTSLYSGLIAWAPKFPKISWFFALENLIFVSIIEEAFWRGFVQKECFRLFGDKGFLAGAGAIFLTAALFAALHYFWVASIPFLGLVFIAGIIYGTIYQYTRSLEASILCHWAFNLTHFICFTYPVLQTAL
ncbi:MAG: CPBP family intramembrane metalloprotease [Verrucomicrobia bacterium]|nr:CPBP family intramembrane metalloprotease [Verrucomicrobiota bacterium]